MPHIHQKKFMLSVCCSVLRSDADAVTNAEAPPARVKREGRGGGMRCPCFFFVAVACENDSSHFSLFSSLPPCNAIFRFYAVGFRVGIENCIFLEVAFKRGAKQTTISNLRNMLFNI